MPVKYIRMISVDKRQTRPWTDGEVERLNKLIEGRLSVDLICNRLGRSFKDVSEEIARLAIVVPAGFFNRSVFRPRK